MINDKIRLLENRRVKTNHILHLLLSLVTAGLWVPIWLMVTILNDVKNKRLDQKIDKLMELG